MILKNFKAREEANSSTINLSDRPAILIWRYETKGMYTVKSFYKIINLRGVLHGNVPIVWRKYLPEFKYVFGY